MLPCHDGDTDADGELLTDGDADREIEDDGEIEADGETLRLTDADGLPEAEGEVDADGGLAHEGEAWCRC